MLSDLFGRYAKRQSIALTVQISIGFRKPDLQSEGTVRISTNFLNTHLGSNVRPFTIRKRMASAILHAHAAISPVHE
jgi:hypothetical protein